eukprot:1154049-Pelagomonas_calceolata.AAC.2
MQLSIDIPSMQTLVLLNIFVTDQSNIIAYCLVIEWAWSSKGVSFDGHCRSTLMERGVVGWLKLGGRRVRTSRRLNSLDCALEGQTPTTLLHLPTGILTGILPGGAGRARGGTQPPCIAHFNQAYCQGANIIKVQWHAREAQASPLFCDLEVINLIVSEIQDDVRYVWHTPFPMP